MSKDADDFDADAIELMPGDVALVMTESGELELHLPSQNDGELTGGQFLLLMFAAAIHDERLQTLLIKIHQERKNDEHHSATHIS